MNLLQSFFYGLVSGLSEFMPISSYGHQVFLRKIFGQHQLDPLLDLMVHIGLLLAIMVSSWNLLLGYAREFSGVNNRYRRGSSANLRRTYDLRFLISASMALLPILIFNRTTASLESNSLWLCLFFVINGVVMYVLDHMRITNKDSSQMSGLDAIITGLLGGLSIFPGISRIGMCLFAAVGRGADKSLAYNWALLLCIPALVLLMVFDIIGLFVVAGYSLTFVGFIYGLIGAIGSFSAGYLTIMLMRLMMVNSGFSSYACYCWGAAMLTFILYLVA